MAIITLQVLLAALIGSAHGRGLKPLKLKSSVVALRGGAAAKHAAPATHVAKELRGGGALGEAKHAAPATRVATELRGGGALGEIARSVANEVATCNTSPARLLGFLGATCSWFLGASGVADALGAGPELISLKMTLTLLLYSGAFLQWSTVVTPPNYILAGSHLFNLLAQGNQLRRCVDYQLASFPDTAPAELRALGLGFGALFAGIGAFSYAAPGLRARSPPGSYAASAAGPFTIHPYPPVTKLFLSLASLTDLWRPVAKISLSQYSALTLTAAIFSKYSLVISPVNWPLCAVNVLLFFSSLWHLARKVLSLV